MKIEKEQKPRKGLIVFSTLVSGALLGAGVAWAASATVNTSQIGEGSGTVSTCDSAWDLSMFAPSYDAASGEYVVSAVEFTNVAAGCNGQTIAVTVTDASNNALGSGSATITDTFGSIALTPSVSAADSTGMASVIYQ